MVTKKPQMSNASVRVALQETFGKLSLKKKKKKKRKETSEKEIYGGDPFTTGACPHQHF